jgi:hypothetical protein
LENHGHFEGLNLHCLGKFRLDRSQLLQGQAAVLRAMSVERRTDIRVIIVAQEMSDNILCRICTELEGFLVAARQPDSPNLFLGLSESGKRNRIHQHEEKILKAEQALKRHANKCVVAQQQPQPTQSLSTLQNGEPPLREAEE